ncbi:DUF4105 domain-containing protein [soil metagenome]
MRSIPLALAILLAVSAHAQQPEGPLISPLQSPVPGVSPGELPSPGTLSSEARVTVLTMLPGREVYAHYGHSAVRVVDPATGLDRTYNYGTFDFDQPHFILRFIRGQLDYELSVAPYDRLIAEYQFRGRTVIEQHLDLPPAVNRRVFQLLEENYRPEHRAYRYSFFFDNCSTRILDILEQASGTPLVPRVQTTAQADSFRDLIDPYIAGDPLVRFGIFLGLGSPTDREATMRERAFLPVELMLALDRARVQQQPLVAVTDTVVWFEEDNVHGIPNRAFDWPAIIFWLLLVAIGGLTAVNVFADRAAFRRGLRVFDIVLLVVAGLFGLLLLFLWFGTEHGVTGNNLNVFWLLPTHLIAAIVYARRPQGRGIIAYGLITAGLTVVFALVTPFLPQSFAPAAYPAMLLLALRLAAGLGGLERQRILTGDAESKRRMTD